MSIPKCEKIFFILPLDNLAGVCYIIRANSKKSCPGCLREEVIVSILRRWPFLLFRKSFNYISFSSFVNRYFSKKYFLFYLLTRRGRAYIICSVCFTWIVCYVLQMVDKRPIFSWRSTFFYFKNRLLYRIAPYCQRLKI